VIPPRPSWTRKLAGSLLLGLGLLWLLQPILQALLFFALGFFVLRHEFDWSRAATEQLRARVPGPLAALESVEAQCIGWTRRQAERLRHWRL